MGSKLDSVELFNGKAEPLPRFVEEEEEEESILVSVTHSHFFKILACPIVLELKEPVKLHTPKDTSVNNTT